jgi:hypothetical protein
MKLLIAKYYVLYTFIYHSYVYYIIWIITRAHKELCFCAVFKYKLEIAIGSPSWRIRVGYPGTKLAQSWSFYCCNVQPVQGLYPTNTHITKNASIIYLYTIYIFVLYYTHTPRRRDVVPTTCHYCSRRRTNDVGRAPSCHLPFSSLEEEKTHKCIIIILSYTPVRRCVHA